MWDSDPLGLPETFTVAHAVWVQYYVVGGL